jgi:hypothetical protein
MDQNYLRPDLLPSTVPTLALWALAVLALAMWAIAHAMVKRRFQTPRLRLGILIPAGTVASWCVFQLLGRYFFLAGRWPFVPQAVDLLFTAFVSGLCIELVSWLYRREASRVPSSRQRRWIVALHMAAICVALWVLLQPVRVSDRERTIRRTVVVLLDDSASMNFNDTYWEDAERLDVAVALGLLPPGEESAALGAFGEKAEDFRRQAAAQRALGEAGAPDAAACKALCEEAGAFADAAATAMENVAKRLDANAHPEAGSALPRVSAFVRGQIRPAIDALASATADAEHADGGAVAREAGRLADALEQLLPFAETVESAGSLATYDGLDADGRAEIMAASDTTRAAIARRLLCGANALPEAPLATLGRSYNLELYRFGATAEPDADLVRAATGAAKAAQKAEKAKEEGAENAAKAEEDAEAALDALFAMVDTESRPEEVEETDEAARETAFRSSTDLTRALETALRDIPFEEIAGFLIVTDGRHTGEAGVDAVSRRIGGAGIPIQTVVVGGTRPPKDLAVDEARAPESVFLGDKVRVAGSISATGLRGTEAKIRLFCGERELDSVVEYVENDDYSHEFRFTDLPEEKGVLRYRVAIDKVDGEEFDNNNEWTLDVSVTDDRTNVLLADDRPRWEFRYLRNLFYGRDKSVHLQEYLVHPDRMAEQDDTPLPPASAARKFGDSESGSFPVDRDEWRKFDVIILGDLGDEVLTPEVVENVKYCVEQRGALLVLIDGPRAMPHRIRNEALLDLMPATFEEDDDPFLASPETTFRLRLAPSGRGHPAMAQSSSSYENEQIWNDVPELTWRHPVKGVKPGAEVLAYAEPEDAATTESVAHLAASDLEQDPEAAVKRLAEMREQQAVHSLVVARNAGHGKVLQLNTDRTWRLRYRVGDTHHHLFWGQVLRWGAGDKLRAGNDYVRLGTDALRYTPTDRVRVNARFQDQDFNALDTLKPEIVVLDATDKEVRRTRLRLREDGNGFYEAELDPFPDPGAYTVWLDCPEAARILGGDYPRRLHTRYVVVTSRRPSELVNVSASAEVPRRMARDTGGVVVRPSSLAKALEGFGEGRKVLHERSEVFLWDHWLVLVLLVGLLAAEWILRKKAGLS